MLNFKNQRELYNGMVNSYYKDLLGEALAEIQTLPNCVVNWDKVKLYTDKEHMERIYAQAIKYKDVNLAVAFGLGGVRMYVHFPYVHNICNRTTWKEGLGPEIPDPTQECWEYGWYNVTTTCEGSTSLLKTRLPAAYIKYTRDVYKSQRALELTGQWAGHAPITRDFGTPPYMRNDD